LDGREGRERRGWLSGKKMESMVRERRIDGDEFLDYFGGKV